MCHIILAIKSFCYRVTNNQIFREHKIALITGNRMKKPHVLREDTIRITISLFNETLINMTANI